MRNSVKRAGLAAAVVGVVALGWAATASAHHSFSMFDTNKTVSITGVVRAWEMVNPHAYLWVNVRKGDEVQVWGIEGGAPAGLVRAGMTKATIKPGDPITVELSPMKDGREGGMMRKLILTNGKTFTFGAPPGSTAKPPMP